MAPQWSRSCASADSSRVRLGDADERGIIRLDGVARVLQDVATDDWEETGLESTDTWVVRRTAIRVAEGGRWPRYKEVLTVTTWCGGVGAAWAERRTNISSRRRTARRGRGPVGAGRPDGPPRSDQAGLLRRLRRGPAGKEGVGSRTGAGGGRRRARSWRGRFGARTSTSWVTSTTRPSGRR